MSHDSVIAGLGQRRATGVRWIVKQPHERQVLLDALREGGVATGTATDALEAWFVENPEGVLVVAVAGCRP